MENWKCISGLENLYQISNLGRIRSVSRKTLMKNGHYISCKGRVLKCSPKRKGYLYCRITALGVKRNVMIHRAVAETFIPNPENKKQVNHIDGNKFNNAVDNLEWCTASENISHGFKHGLIPALRGEKNGSSKATESQALRVISLLKDGILKHRQIADKVGVSKNIVKDISRGKTWRHLQIN